MHVVFGVSTLVMVLATIWMIADDYVREWKDYQADYFQIARWSDQAQLRQTRAESEHELRAQRAELRAAQSQSVADAVVDRFVNEVKAENERLEELGRRLIFTDFDEIAAARQELEQAAQQAEKARQDAEAAHARVVEAVAAQRAARAQAEESEQAQDLTRAAIQEAEQARQALNQAELARVRAEDAAIEARTDLLRLLSGIVAEARRREDTAVREKKFVAATHTEKLSELDAANAEGAGNISTLQAEIDRLKGEMDRLDSQIAEAKSLRTSLEGMIRNDIRGEELAVQKQVDAIQQELERLRGSIEQRSVDFGDKIVRAPILEAFDTSEMRIDNGWLPELTINYNFTDVARFDRCATCHKAIDKTAPGSATQPAYPTIQPDEQTRVVELATPDDQPEQLVDSVTGEPETPSEQIRRVYGFTLADRGQLDPSAVTIEVVFPESAAAKAGLMTGDVIEEIAGGRIFNRQLVEHYLLEITDWGRPVAMTVRRGLPHPYTSHPRLDLYIGSLSPHPKGEMGCTICHDGQGSATTFKYASHTPNHPTEANEWREEHDWFFNHHWIFPMTPRRFLESNCLKCHHEVVELEPSERFPDPPAPKLVAGWKAILNYGCYGCHEINGYDGGRRVGPDLRSEPNFFAVAQQILRDPGLTDQERGWARSLTEDPYDNDARNKLRVSIEADDPSAGDQEADAQQRLSADTHGLSEMLKDVENPGELRRVGPSLRFLDHKVDFAWLYNWIGLPSDFRPSTKMPQFFGLHSHLDDEKAAYVIEGLNGPAEGDEPQLYTDREFTRRMEAVEIRAIAEYLLTSSGDFEYLDPPEEVTEAPSAERGKVLFQTRGCLACHSHKDFPGMESDHGPELSNVAAKLDTEEGRQWLYTWLRQPSRYHVRTKMPDLYLDPIQQIGPDGKPTGAITDPAADIAAYLLSVPADWAPEGVPPRESLTEEELEALETLALEWMSANFSIRQSKEYLRRGSIPESVGEQLKGDEQVFVGRDPQNRIQTMLEYVGRRSISKYGCFGCHDVPGFESAKPIGTGLADWGRKDPSRLAFEQIHRFLQTHGIGGDQEAHGHAGHGDFHGLDPTKFDADTGYYVMAMNMHQRQGFIWQKLRMPRSYDYLKTRNKGYNERLRMPQFPLSEDEREAIITFVLGLTAETPAAQYVYQPGERQRAIMDGRLLLSKYNCGGCHTLEMEQWNVAFEPDTFQVIAPEDYPFLHPEFSGEEMAASTEQDRRGLFHTELVGMPVLNEQTGEPQRYDIDGLELTPQDTDLDPYYSFVLYQPALVQGQAVPEGQPLLVPAEWGAYGPKNGEVYPFWGGDLARYLFPHVIAAERQAGKQVTAKEAWGWLPPALIGEGRKVQTDWLHDFLLNPYQIRPAVVLRMPRFNMSTDEASQLANYFAAVDNANYPYEYNERQQESYLEVVHRQRPNHLEDAFKILLDSKNYCAQCHSIGDFETQQALRQQGPNLAQVGERLREDYLRRWIANPQKVLPYTGMPVNFPYGKEVAQNLYPGSSLEQVDAVVDLLTNFDLFIQQHFQISPLVEAAAQQAEPQASQQPTSSAAGGQ